MSKQIEARDKRLRNPIFRSFAVTREAVDEASRTVRLAFASDAPVDHWMGPLILTTKPNAVRQDRMKLGLALLDNHDRDEQIGIVENFSFDSDGIMRGDARFSKSEEADEVFQDVLDGIKRFVSVGFMIYELHVESEVNDIYTYRCDDWEPFEISIVSVPADIGVGVGRAMDDTKRDDGEGDGEENICPECEMPMEECQCEPAARNLQVSKANPPLTRAQSNSKQLEKNMKDENEKPGTPVVETQVAEVEAAKRAKAIVEFAEVFGQGELARQMISASDDITLDDVRAAIKAKQAPAAQIVPPAPDEAAKREGVVQLARTMPRFGTLKNFTRDNGAERAYRFGQWFLAARGIEKAVTFCRENGITLTRAMSEGVNESGGFLVPEEFGNDLIDLREIYGVFRRNAKMVAMASDTRTDPRRDGGLTAYFEGEGDTGTYSDKAWGRVSLTAKKLMVLARYSSEVNEDALINFGDDLAGEIAYAFALKEDQCGFLGDGSSTYGGIQGVTTKIKGLSGTIANIAGLVVGSGNAYSELVLTDFEAVAGKLPIFADTPQAKWYAHKSFYWNVMKKLELASGGVTAAEVGAGGSPRFLGYPVELTQVMPKTEANSQVCCLLGDLSLAASFGSRRDTTIAISEHSRFANDQLEIRGTERFDINVHDVGNADATAANRVEGPIVGLITAAS